MDSCVSTFLWRGPECGPQQEQEVGHSNLCVLEQRMEKSGTLCYFS